MRILHATLAASVAMVGLPLVIFACGGDDSAAPQPDASDGASEADTTVVPNDALTPLPDGNVRHCTLAGGNDPVGLCTQKIVLGTLHTAAFDPKKGLAASFDSKTFSPDDDDAGAILHDLHDDVAYAAAIGVYTASASRYGDTEINSLLDPDLLALAPIMEDELAILPDEYSGELYTRLRTAAGALRILNDNADGAKIDALADAYGRAIFTKYFFALAGTTGGGDAGMPDGASPSDAGGDANPGDAGDAGTSDSGVSGSDGIIGRPAGAGAYAYVSADSATAALALIDLAARNPSDPDSAGWQTAAVRTLAHLSGRAREATTGMFYRALVTSVDPGHDGLDTTVTPGAPSDVLLSDVQATIALSCLRALDLTTIHAVALPIAAAFPFQDTANAAVSGLDGTPSLYDGPPGDAGATSTGVMEGFVPSTSSVLTGKTTRANAFLLATLHRLNLLGGTPYAYQINPLRHVLLDAIGPANVNTSLFTVIPDQNAYFRASTRDFHLADAGPADPRPASYKSRAVLDFVEGINENFWGLP